MAILAPLVLAFCILPSASAYIGPDGMHREVVPASTGAQDGSYEWTMGATAGYTVFHAWYSSEPLDLNVYSPNGTLVEQQLAQKMTSGDFAVTDGGTYTFIWTNQLPRNVALNFTVVTQKAGTAEAVYKLSLALCAALIVVLVIVMLVVVILLRRRDHGVGHARPRPPTRYQGPTGRMVEAARSCSRCGASVGQRSTLCPRCGKPLP